jgi:hypothetical protein
MLNKKPRVAHRGLSGRGAGALEPTKYPGVNRNTYVRLQLGGPVMRIMIAFAILASSLALGGCFHHNQAAYAEPLPPMSHPPLK